MIKNYFSRYRPRYIRSLVYMMQASEYYRQDYLRWFWRTRDFTQVEKRKTLQMTAKAIALLGTGYALAVVLLMLSVWLVLQSSQIRIVGLVLFLVYPFILPYLLLLALGLFHLIQRPVEARLVAQAGEMLRKHRGEKIAIAGSFGKTTMREIVKTILSQGKKVAAPPGSYNTPLGIASFVKTLKGDEDVLIFELGEYYPDDIKKLCQFVQPEWGIITGVNEAHLERFGTLEKTRETIFELADWLQSKPLYINNESSFAGDRAKASHTIYDRHGAGGWKVESAETSVDGTMIKLTRGADTITAMSRLLGLHNVGPICAAADIASRLGLTPRQIAEGIAGTKPFSHRLEPRTEGGIVTIDDSYNGSPDGVVAAIEFLRVLKGSRRWYVTPGLVEMGSHKEEVHRDIGRKLTDAGIEKVVLIKDSVTPYIAMELNRGQLTCDVLWFDDMPTALKSIQTMTIPGDVILIQNDWPDQYA